MTAVAQAQNAAKPVKEAQAPRAMVLNEDALALNIQFYDPKQLVSSRSLMVMCFLKQKNMHWHSTPLQRTDLWV